MSRLIGAMAGIIQVFQEYAGKDGDAKTLSKAEVKTLLSKEFGAKLEVRFRTSLHNVLFTEGLPLQQQPKMLVV